MTVQRTIEPLARNDAGIAVALPILAQRFGERFVRSEAIRQQHGATTTWLATQPPDAVIFAHSTEEVVEIVRVCGDHRVPIIPFGVGTSLEGHVNAPLGGVSVDMSQMNRILAVHAEDLDVRGRGRRHPQAAQRASSRPRACSSRSIPAPTRRSAAWRQRAPRAPTPSATAPCATTSSTSPPSCRTATVIKTARRARKSSAGYDLTRLLVGSEGTLGIITELTIRLYGIPEAIAGGVCPFDSIEGACNATILTIQMGIPVARIELLDALKVKAVNAYSKLDLPETADALPRVPRHRCRRQGAVRAVRRDRRANSAAASSSGRPSRRIAPGSGRLAMMRLGRHGASARRQAGRDRRLRADLAACRVRRGDRPRHHRRSGLIAPIVGHVGDGNFHVQVMVDTTTPPRSSGPRNSSAVSICGRSRWTAPAPASTASARER